MWIIKWLLSVVAIVGGLAALYFVFTGFVGHMSGSYGVQIYGKFANAILLICILYFSIGTWFPNSLAFLGPIAPLRTESMTERMLKMYALVTPLLIIYYLMVLIKTYHVVKSLVSLAFLMLWCVCFGYLASMIIGFVIFVFGFITLSSSAADSAGAKARCPYCGGPVSSSASRCHSCGTDFYDRANPHKM